MAETDSTSTTRSTRQQQLLRRLQQQPSSQQQPPPHRPIQSNFLAREKSRSRGVKNGMKVVRPTSSPSPTTSSSSSSQGIIILEEGKDLAVFWNGENSVPLIKWDPSLETEAQQNNFYASIGDFLATFAAGKYLKRCSMSLQASSTKYINNLRMSDPFSKILDQQKEDKPVTLMLTHNATPDESQGGYAKFTLHMREAIGKRVLWDGIKCVGKMVAKLNQADMGLTVENCLKSYVAAGYLQQNCQVDLVKDCSDLSSRKPGGAEELLSAVPLEDLVKTLFTGNSATISIRNVSIKSVDSSSADPYSANETPKENPESWLDEALSGNPLSSSSTRIPVFLTPSASTHWTSITWGDIREEVRILMDAVEITMRDRIISTETYASLTEKKRQLETAIRRRTRVVDEVWRSYSILQRAHTDLLNANTVTDQAGTSVPSLFETPGHSSHSIVPERPSASTTATTNNSSSRVEGDAALTNVNQQRRSCLDLLSSTIVRCGMELELFDDETQGMNRIAGVGIGVAVLFAICTVVFYF